MSYVPSFPMYHRYPFRLFLSHRKKVFALFSHFEIDLLPSIPLQRREFENGLEHCALLVSVRGKGIGKTKQNQKRFDERKRKKEQERARKRKKGKSLKKKKQPSHSVWIASGSVFVIVRIVRSRKSFFHVFYILSVHVQFT